jgi:hypothetical protein
MPLVQKIRQVTSMKTKPTSGALSQQSRIRAREMGTPPSFWLGGAIWLRG